MATADADLEAVKEIPGYKAILKAVLKGQIQQLVEQLAAHTDEESIILTASVADGTLSHLGSVSGKGFLNNHEDIKSQFLGFCLKKHHMLQQSERDQPGSTGNIQTTSATGAGRSRQPTKLESPQHQHPGLTIRSSPRVRIEPYSVKRRSGRRSVGLENAKSLVAMCKSDVSSDKSVSETVPESETMTTDIKIELVDSSLDEPSHVGKYSEQETHDERQSMSRTDTTSDNQSASQSEDRECVLDNDDDDDESISEHSSKHGNIIPNVPEGLMLEPNLTDLISVSSSHDGKTGADVNTDWTVNMVKVEAISQSEMELDLAGTERGIPGEAMCSSDPNNGAMGILGDAQPVSNSQSIKNLEDSLKMKVIEHGTQDQMFPTLIRMRFGNQSTEDIRSKVSSPVRRNSSERAYRFATESFRQYLSERNENTDFENFGTAKLADILSGFYINARTKEGEMYKLKSLIHLRSSLSRYLKSQRQSRNMDIISGEEFRDANKVFKTALGEIKASGKGDIVHHAIISHHDLFTLYSSSHLSPDTPVGLQNRVQMNLRLSFSHVMNKNMDKMTKDTFLISSYDDGTLYVHRHPSLNSSGSTCDAEDETSAQCHMVQDKNNTFLCPVSSFQFYLARLHPMCDRLWQHPVERELGDIWYQKNPMGHNTLAKFMSNLSKDVPLSRTYTNNSIRITGNAIRVDQRSHLIDVMTVGAVKIE